MDLKEQKYTDTLLLKRKGIDYRLFKAFEGMNNLNDNFINSINSLTEEIHANSFTLDISNKSYCNSARSQFDFYYE